MLSTEMITPLHLARKAIIYIRQPSPHQRLTNQESLRLQYALKQKALELGWPEDSILTIDCDLGLTGAAADHREGFKEIIAQVTLSQVGIILSYDVTRLSRNCSDWYPLLDICGYIRGNPAMGKIFIKDSHGSPFTQLEPIMGAFAHIVAINEDFKTIAHVHPMGDEPTKNSDRGGPELEFHVEPNKPGFWKIWVQVKIKGKELFIPFGVRVK